MNTESQQQIAVEAAKEIAAKIPHSFGFLQGREFVPIILSAIERAETLWAWNKIPAAQPQRSEQQEWTPEIIERYVARQELTELAKAINAALTSERDKVENLHKILGKKRVEIRELKEELTDERQRREHAEQTANHNADIGDSIARALVAEADALAKMKQ